MKWANSKAGKAWEDKEYKFIVRRNPRDLSRIYVLHPAENHYIEIPYQAIGNPAITLWEYKFAIKRIKDKGRNY